MSESSYDVLIIGSGAGGASAALLRFSPHEFETDTPHQCFGWSDAECNLLDALARKPNFTLLTGQEV